MERDHRPPIDHRALLAAYQQAVEAYRQRPTLPNAQREHAAALELTAALALPGRFALGQIVATPGALTAIGEAGHIPAEFLLRHKHGDWGELPPEDVAENERAVQAGSRIFSSYRTRLATTLWTITEHDRSITTLLLPDEY